MKRKKLLTLSAVIMGLMLSVVLTSCGSGGSMPYDGLNLDDYLTVGKYTGLETEKIKVKVSEQEIQEKVEAALKENQKNEKLEKGEVLKKGDTANIDYLGKVDGKEFDGGASQGFDLELGSNAFIEGFEDGLIGTKVGDTTDVEVTFPEDYQGKKVAGKDAVFTVTVNSATRPNVPEYDEAFVKKYTDFKTKKEYEESLRQSIYDEKETQAKTEQKNSLWSDVLEGTKVKKYPEKEMEAYKEVFDAQIDSMAKQGGITRSEVLKQMYGTDDEAQVKSIIEDSVKTLIKQEMLTEYIADKEDLTYTDEEKEQTIADVEKQGYDEETVMAYTGRTLEQYAHIRLLYEKVQDFILDNAKVKK